MTKSKEIHLKSRPQGMPAANNFELAEVNIASPKDGQMLIRNIWMSVDPYMRGRMIDQESYIPPFQIGEPLQGGAIGQVVESAHSGFSKGDYVSHMFGWREYTLSDGMMVNKVDPKLAPLEAYLGVLGMPGLTAYAGLMRAAGLKEGDQVLVSAAAGAVGATVCQLAKAKGCYVAGSAGSDEKCQWLEKEAGIDKAVNYKTCGNLTKAFMAAMPKGADVYFENVGGDHLEAALWTMNPMGRMAMCGMISQYNNKAPAPGPNNLIMIVGKSLRLQGFIVSNHMDMMPDFIRDVGALIQAGKMKWQQTVADGVEKAPEAFMNLFTGGNTGKMLVRLGEE